MRKADTTPLQRQHYPHPHPAVCNGSGDDSDDDDVRTMGDADTTPYKCLCLWLPRDSRRHGGAEEDGQEVHQTLTEWQKESGPEGLNEMGAILNN